MPDDWNHENEDWTDDIDLGEDDVGDDDESISCPECGGHVYSGADKCPACGYWLSAADRRAAGTDSSQPKIIRTIVAAILVIFLIAMLVAGIRLF
jgi:ribosomal protein L37E